MMTVNEVSKLTGVSIRALRHYDQLGLLKPARVTQAGYRLYDQASLERLQSILLFKELQFPLKEIARILDSPDFDRNRALEQQIQLLQMRKEHLENLILLAKGLKMKGTKFMDFKAFDTQKIDEYAAWAKASWGKTQAWQEYEQKSQGRSRAEEKALEEQVMALMGAIVQKGQPEAAFEEVKALQGFITANLYTCTDQILRYLGQMYAGGGDVTEHIDAVWGQGAGAFCHEAVESYLAKKGRNP
ncbi:MAG: MerR family transcriptional regulator [Clostridia bacterium]|nr:MerR family transcriptional regulator [Clostridia bacterium]